MNQFMLGSLSVDAFITVSSCWGLVASFPYLNGNLIVTIIYDESLFCVASEGARVGFEWTRGLYLTKKLLENHDIVLMSDEDIS